jgi:DNA-binding NarL/FixJ family response regulator
LCSSAGVLTMRPVMFFETEFSPSPDAGTTSPSPSTSLRAVCVARHSFLSEHLARFFAELGVSTCGAVGLESAAQSAIDVAPDIIICDYDVLVNLAAQRLEQNPLLASVPVVAVSLTRHAEELHLLDLDGIAGFLYLPTLNQAAALKILHTAAARPKFVPGPVGSPQRVVEHS